MSINGYQCQECHLSFELEYRNMMTIEQDAIKLNGYNISIRPMCNETSYNCDIIWYTLARYLSRNKINYSNVL